ncbi:MAG: NAD(P)/FAD-dependent oxidoreductase, partial [Clostridia bacterium]|nr:NAD(P)/FAD-dependent oxidoreductase [Clostridia bacterium]
MDAVRIRVKDIKISLLHWDKTSPPLSVIVAKKLGIPTNKIRDLKTVKRGVDARNKNEILLVFTFDVSIDKKLLGRVINKPYVTLAKDAEELNEPLLAGSESLSYQPIVIGTGPAGLFAALTLARSGYKPLVFERGAKVGERTQDIMQFWHTGALKTDSNVQFGEGGAGTFSDGKLTTRIKDRRTRMVLTELVGAGAPAEILFQQKPHLGTDNLATIVQRLREKIISLGGQVFFHSKVTDITLEHNQITGIEINHQYYLPVQVVVLAIGHSARDTFEVLIKRGIELQQKPFAMGVR